MTLLSRSTRSTTSVIRSSQTSLIPRRNASSFKFTSNNPLKPKASTKPPPIWSHRLFELPKPRPIAKQRYESAAGVMESSALVLGMGVVGILYGRSLGEEEVIQGDFVESQEDRDVHDWIRPFDCYVVEEVISGDVNMEKVDEGAAKNDVDIPLVNIEMGVRLLEINRSNRSP